MVKRLLYLNGLAVLGVVINHAVGWGYVAMFWWTHRYLDVSTPNFSQMGSFQYFGLRSAEQLIMYSISTFLFVSGFFTAFSTRSNQSFPGWKFISTRIRYLVIPYLLWSVVMIAVNLIDGAKYNALDILRMLLLGQATPAFYFIPLLSQLYLLTPLLTPLAKNKPKVLLGLSAILQLGVHAVRYATTLGALPTDHFLTLITPGWFFPGSIFWFSLGIVIGFHYSTIKPVLQKIRWALVAAAVILIPLAILEWESLIRLSGQSWLTQKETLLDHLYSAAFILGFLAFDQVKLPLSQQISDLGSKSFGIYLVHSLVLIYAAKAVYHLFPGLLSMQFIFQPILISAGLAVPLALMALVKRTPMRKIYAYQFG